MVLEKTVRDCLAAAAEEEGLPTTVTTRLERLASAIADGELNPQTERSEFARRVEVLMTGFDK